MRRSSPPVRRPSPPRPPISELFSNDDIGDEFSGVTIGSYAVAAYQQAYVPVPRLQLTSILTDAAGGGDADDGEPLPLR